MRDRPVGPIDGVLEGIASAAGPLQSIDPGAAFDAMGAARAPIAFAIVLVFGGVLVWRREPFVDRAIEATMDRPLAAVGYGLAAHAVIVFVGVYLATRLSQIVVSGRGASGIGLLVGGLLLAVAATVGFTVVGGTLVDLWGTRYHWSGVLVGALIAGIVAVGNPAFGGVVWVAVVSVGIGGPVRTWLHASVGADA